VNLRPAWATYQEPVLKKKKERKMNVLILKLINVFCGAGDPS
jgi:hypothetical protein